MKKRYAYILSTLILILILSGFTSGNNFPAPIKEPVAALYLNFSSSGIFEENNKEACEEIASNTANLCKLRNNTSNTSITATEYKESALNLLNDSIARGFLKIHEVYFYYKDYKEYALIAKGEFDISTIAEKSNAEMIFDKKEELSSIFTSINLNIQNSQKMLLQANKNTLVICPEDAFNEVMKNLEESNNQLGESFKTFVQMIKLNPVISAEVKLQKLLEEQKINNIPKPITATRLIRLFVAPQQNKLQLSIPEEKDREELKEEIQKLTLALNSVFENKTDYKIEEGKTSLFIETKADEKQMQAISRKAMAFMLHFFVKNISSTPQ